MTRSCEARYFSIEQEAWGEGGKWCLQQARATYRVADARVFHLYQELVFSDLVQDYRFQLESIFWLLDDQRDGFDVLVRGLRRGRRVHATTLAVHGPIATTTRNSRGARRGHLAKCPDSADIIQTRLYALSLISAARNGEQRLSLSQ